MLWYHYVVLHVSGKYTYYIHLLLINVWILESQPVLYFIAGKLVFNVIQNSTMHGHGNCIRLVKFAPVLEYQVCKLSFIHGHVFI